MRKWMIALSACILSGTGCIAQLYIEPIAGYQYDLNNHGHFNQLNTGVQAAFSKGRNYELVVKVQKSWGFPYRSSDSSFTANPSLPLYAAANKTIRPSIWFFSVDHRFKINSRNPKQRFSFLLLTGFTDQRLTVNYQYDKVHYTILNPDATQKMFSLYVGAGVEYMRFIGNNRVFAQLTISSPPVSNAIKYPSSFSYMAPLAFNAGYSIFIKKKKHEK
ncbi:MAG TPA: hypothetical protein VG847_14845 [Chitinophagaceae bacterium]|nr:hypothetical protein [Chitinophagaceae bacterium]